MCVSLINKSCSDVFRTTCRPILFKSAALKYNIFSSLSQPTLWYCIISSRDSGTMFVAMHTTAQSASSCASLSYNCPAIKSLTNCNNLHVKYVCMKNYRTAVIYCEICAVHRQNSNKDVCSWCCILCLLV